MRRRCRPEMRPATGTRRCPTTGARGRSAAGAGRWRGAFAGADRLYGYARHIVETTFVATSTGLRRRYTQPTGSVEINAKRDGASAWAGSSTPDFVDVPTDSMLDELSTRLGWAQRTVELPAGRYETMLPPSAVADLMIYLSWTMDGRGAQEGRTAFSAPGGGTRVGEKLSELPLTLYSDPYAARFGMLCRSWRRPVRRSEPRCSTTAWTSTGWTGFATGRSTRWRIHGRRPPNSVRRLAAPADNLLMTGGHGRSGRHDRGHRARVCC